MPETQRSRHLFVFITGLRRLQALARLQQLLPRSSQTDGSNRRLGVRGMFGSSGLISFNVRSIHVKKVTLVKGSVAILRNRLQVWCKDLWFVYVQLSKKGFSSIRYKWRISDTSPSWFSFVSCFDPPVFLFFWKRTWNCFSKMNGYYCWWTKFQTNTWDVCETS